MLERYAGKPAPATNEYYMTEALKEARKAYNKLETPIGAVVVFKGEIISRGHNLKESKNDATLHAEIQAIRKASAKLGNWRMNECDLYVTLEPCTMCAGAIIQSRIRRLYFGAYDQKAGAAGSVINVFSIKEFNHKVEVYQSILEDTCSAILKDFFAGLRKSRIDKLTKGRRGSAGA